MEIRPLRSDEWDHVAKLIHESTNTWYERNLNRRIFGGDWKDCRVFPEVYEALDPGCCLVAETGGGEIVGSCFYHPRASHFSLGIMNVAAGRGGEGVAGRLLREVIALAGDLPVRLVSSAMNLDSYSLYTRAGFVPYELFQDMSFPEGVNGEAEPAGLPPVREAEEGDVPAIVELEKSLLGISRRQDIEMFVRNTAGIWSCAVSVGDDGELNGFMASVDHPGSRMLGPGLAVDAEVALALILGELRRERGGTPVLLVPARCHRLVAELYRLGARNCELHLGQALGSIPQPQGIMMPSFLPESG